MPQRPHVEGAGAMRDSLDAETARKLVGAQAQELLGCIDEALLAKIREMAYRIGDVAVAFQEQGVAERHILGFIVGGSAEAAIEAMSPR